MAKMTMESLKNFIIKTCHIRGLSSKKNRYAQFQQQSVRVAILGADTPLGELVALLLKQNTLVSGIFLQGTNRVLGIAEDMKSMDTRSKVQAFHGPSSYGNAARSADIVLILNSLALKGTTTAKKAFKAEAPRIWEIAEECSGYAPKSVVINSACPVSLTLPLMRNVYRKGHWYHPGKIMGGLGSNQVNAISMVANQQGLDPYSVNVPIIGGPDPDCMVPLFSRATPVPLTSYEAEILLKKFREISDDANIYKTPVSFKPDVCVLGKAYALNRLVTTVGLGLCQDAGAIGNVFVRTNVIPTVKHCVCTVKFGPEGVYHNFGVPKLTNMELQLLEKALLILTEREEYVEKYMKFMEEEKVIQAEAEKKKRMSEEDTGPSTPKYPEVKVPFVIDDPLPCKIEEG